MALQRWISILSQESRKPRPSTVQRTPLPRPNSPRTWVKHFLLECCLASAAAQAHRSGRAAEFRKPPSLSQMYWTRSVTLARATLENLGLQVSTTIQAVPGLLPNVVGFQEPNIGSVVPLGTTISLVVGQ